jgi:hypothetical protein
MKRLLLLTCVAFIVCSMSVWVRPATAQVGPSPPTPGEVIRVTWNATAWGAYYNIIPDFSGPESSLTVSSSLEGTWRGTVDLRWEEAPYWGWHALSGSLEFAWRTRREQISCNRLGCWTFIRTRITGGDPLWAASYLDAHAWWPQFSFDTEGKRTRVMLWEAFTCGKYADAPGSYLDEVFEPGFPPRSSEYHYRSHPDAIFAGYPLVPTVPCDPKTGICTGTWTADVTNYYTSDGWGQWPYEVGAPVHVTWEITLQPIASGTLPDLRVSEPKLAQVVWDPDINGDGRTDLVAERKTRVEAQVVADDVAASETRSVIVQATLNNVVLDSQAFTLRQLQGGRRVAFDFVPNATGKGDLKITVDPGGVGDTPTGFIDESDETNNTATVSVDVKPTRELHVRYEWFQYNLPLTAEETRAYGDAAAAASNPAQTFLRATFPVARSSLSGSAWFLGPSQGLGADPRDCHDLGDPDEPLLWDFTRVSIQAELTTVGTPDAVRRGVGFVPPGYFLYRCHLDEHGNPADAFGISVGSLPTMPQSVLVRVDTPPDVVAHELGHSFGLEDLTIPGTTSGFWLEPDPPRGRIENAGDVMSQKDSGWPLWFARDDYEHLFYQLLQNQTDPEILLVSGVLWKEGRIDLGTWYYLPAGTATPSDSGQFAVRVFDGNGTPLSEFQFQPQFVLHRDPGGDGPTNGMPIVVKVPFPANAARVEIVSGSNTLAAVNPVSKLLLDAVRAIPEQAFVGQHVEQATTLVNKVKAFETIMGHDGIGAALNKLQNDIRPHVETWLAAGYEKTNPLEVSKAELLQLIDNLIARLESRL